MRSPRTPDDILDHILTTQLAVAWAGEAGEEPRLGWWKTDLASEFGGEVLFARLLPATWRWAVLEGAREAARRVDAAGRAQHHAPDRLFTLFHLGPEVDEHLGERLRDHKRSGLEPKVALPRLAPFLGQPWAPQTFLDWLPARGKAEPTTTSIGRELRGPLPPSLPQLIDRLAAALAPLHSAYPLPHAQGPA